MKNDPQLKTPFLDALLEYVHSKPTPFDVPGHKLGRFVTDLSRRLSPVILGTDANAPIGLDNLYNAKGVIKQSEDLMAKLCHADHCLFSVNGTTGGILSMFLAALDNKDKVILPRNCHNKDKVILPRNCHKSVINALIISGAVPIFVLPDIDEELGIANGVSTKDYIQAMDDHPDAKAVFVINPTYFGIACDLVTIAREAHRRNMVVLVDEAHGSSFYFGQGFPISAMDAGCDISSVSIHKNSGSLTQSSVILTKGDRLPFDEVKRAFGMLSSTSPNSLLIASLDAARKELYVRGKDVYAKDIALALYAKKEIARIPGISCRTKEEILGDRKSDAIFDVDETKLVISVRDLGLYGYDVYKELRAQSNIQLELGEVFVVLALIGPGTQKEDVDRLVEAFEGLSQRHSGDKKTRRRYTYQFAFPKTVVPPREGYDAPSKVVSLKDAVGEISAETVMAYPPGIPLVIPGELVDRDVVRMIEFYYRENGQVLKDSEPRKMKVIDRSRWYLAQEYPFL